jgi:hypothetical protein
MIRRRRGNCLCAAMAAHCVLLACACVYLFERGMRSSAHLASLLDLWLCTVRVVVHPSGQTWKISVIHPFNSVQHMCLGVRQIIKRTKEPVLLLVLFSFAQA